MKLGKANTLYGKKWNKIGRLTKLKYENFSVKKMKGKIKKLECF